MFFVRTASVRDAEKVQKLLHTTWHATYDSIHGPEKVDEICDKWHSLDAIKSKMEGRFSEYVVADNGTEIGGVGFAIAPDKAGIAQLSQLYVLPELQGQGIGTDLLGEIEQSFLDVKAMRIEVDPKNEQAIAFYKAHGYAQIGETSDCGGGGDNMPALIFEKKFDEQWSL